MKKLISISLFLLTSVMFGQGGFTYSYVDPCSKQTKTIFVTGNQNVTVNYLGNLGSFSQNDFLNGSFDLWMTQIQTQAASQPCDELLTNTTTSQNMFITQNLISTLSSVTSVASMTSSSVLSNSVSNIGDNGNGGSNGGGNSNNQQNTTNNGTNSNSQGNTSNSSSSSNGGTQQGGSSSTGSSSSSGGGQEGGTTNQSGNVPQGGGGTSQRGVGSQGQNTTDGSTKPNESGSGAGGTTNSVSNAAESSSGGGGKGRGGKVNTGSIIGTGDIVAIRVNDDKSNQLRGTMSVTKSNTNNTRSKGFLLNYTTNVNNSNLTLYGSFTNKKTNNVFIVANSSMLDLDRNFFNTTTALETRKFGKTSVMGGLNFTVGGLGGEMFANLSAVGGGFHPFKVSKNLSGSLLVLGVYSPFTQFYEGKWWDSGLLIVPFSSWDYAISKNFKYNVSISGTYELKGNFLQFQILTGGKILL